jgi:hypothetical protein
MRLFTFLFKYPLFGLQRSGIIKDCSIKSIIRYSLFAIR